MKLVAFAAAPLAATVLLLIGPMGGMPLPAWRTAAVGVLMAIWWVTEAVPIAATALLPIVLFPLLGIADVTASAAPYANPIIYLFFGGFILAAAFERSRLHARLALALLSVVGAHPDRIVLGFMIACAFVSMWVSNTAAVLMMLPLATSILNRWQGDENTEARRAFERALLLGIAYAASIGGYGTLVGTPPNALLAGFVQQTHGIRLGFGQYMLLGVPLVLLGIPVTWLLLTRVVFRVESGRDVGGGAAAIAAQRQGLGPMSRAEKYVASIAVATSVAWITQPLLARIVPGISEAGIGVACAAALLIVPIDRKWTRAIDWETAERIPWGVLVLFGGGLSLAAAIQGSGLAQWIGNSVGGLRGVSPLVLILVVVGTITMLTEFTSNTATAAAFLPIASSLAVGAGISPLMLTVAAGLAASNGFMLPVGTPPNAIVFASGRFSIPQMIRAGALVDALFVLLITAVAYYFVLPVLG